MLDIIMKTISKILAIIAFFSVIFLGVKLRSHPCEFQVTSGEAISVQSKKRIYNKIFNDRTCPPKKIFLSVPDNLKSETGKPITFKGNQSAPKITTIISVSNKSNRFFVGRIDQIAGQWVYTKYDTCLAWKWSIENEEQVLHLSFEKNLDIYSDELEKIIFIVSIPFELIEKNPEIWVKPYTWNRVGGFYKQALRGNPELTEVLRSVEEDNPESSDIFYPGKEVSPSLASELNDIDKMGGVHYNRELEQNMVQLDAQGYQASPQSGYCAVPQDLVDPTEPNKCNTNSDK
ncbi:hypothetical protein ACE1CD_02880 [Aerosakkonema sp. BLCC-F183]|uniref:hypothetical protein n=1 Tax=Aerosakkonema sp. BLCC-F183 TaxID=3342834 RepID=UPI0035B92FBC